MTIQQLREKRVHLIQEARKILDKADGEHRQMTAEEDAEFTRMHDEADDLKRQIDDLERTQAAAAARAARQESAEAHLEQLQGSPADRARLLNAGLDMNAGGGAGGRPGQVSDEDRAMAIQGWFLAQTMREPPTDRHREAGTRCGIDIDGRVLTIDLHDNFSQVRNALKSNVPGQGGALRLGEFMGPLEQAMLLFGPMLEVAQVIRTSHANPLPWPTANDTTNTGRQIGESKPVAENDPNFTAPVWGAYKFTSDEILVPFELLRDSAFNLAAIIAEMLGERLGRIQNTKFTVGTGAGTAHGIVPRSVLGKSGASATAIAADELFDLQHSVPRAYRMGAGFMAHDSTFKAVRKLKDGDNRYLWQPGFADGGGFAGQPDTLLNWPTHTNDDMAEIAASQKTILAGQFNKYKVRQVNRVRLYRLTERHRENDQDAFLAFVEADGNLLDAGPGPVRHYIQAA